MWDKYDFALPLPLVIAAAAGGLRHAGLICGRSGLGVPHITHFAAFGAPLQRHFMSGTPSGHHA